MDKQQIKISCSSLGDLLDCSWRKAFEPRDEKTIGVSSIVGNQTHRLMAGEELQASPEGQKVITYDQHTPSRRDINQQAIAISRDFSAYYEKQGMTVIEQELSLESEFTVPSGDIATLKGRIDAVCENREGRIVIVDYKTGSNVNDVVLQLAAYALLWNDNNPDRKTYGGAYLWRKRGRSNTLEYGFIAYDALYDVMPFIVDAYRATLNPTPNPRSMSCYYCGVEDCLAAVARRSHNK